MTEKLFVPSPTSGGLFLSYKCTCSCRHCMYACSPRWKADWLSEKDAEDILVKLSGKIQANSCGPEYVGINSGLHFTGGEPFMNFELLHKFVQVAEGLKIPSTFVETNCFWCMDEEGTREKLSILKKAGLKGLLVSVNPFIIEEVPFERTERAVRIGREIFGTSLIVYQEFFYHLFHNLGIKDTLSFDRFLRIGGESLNYVELIPMGRAAYELGFLFKKSPAIRFFGASCREELQRSWHVHIDNYGNYITGYCGGITVGKAEKINFDYLKINLDDYPLLKALVSNIKELYELGAAEFSYEERAEGYISKCHLCLDIRKHIALQTGQFKELLPREFYLHLEQ